MACANRPLLPASYQTPRVREPDGGGGPKAAPQGVLPLVLGSVVWATDSSRHPTAPALCADAGGRRLILDARPKTKASGPVINRAARSLCCSCGSAPARVR
jgi:hypothetical protein